MILGAAAHKHPPLLFLFCFSSPVNPCLKLLLVMSLTKVRLLVCSEQCLSCWPTLSHSFLALLHLLVAVCRWLWSSHIVSSCGAVAILLVFISTLSHTAEGAWGFQELMRIMKFHCLALWKKSHMGCSIACSHKRSEGNHLSLPLHQEQKQADRSSLPFNVEITSSGKMETLTFHHLSANAAYVLHTKIGYENTVKTEKPMRQEMPELGLVLRVMIHLLIR